MSISYYICAYDSNNNFVGTITGMGRNKNTLDSSFNTVKTARKHANLLAQSKKWAGHTFKIETMTHGECFGNIKNKH